MCRALKHQRVESKQQELAAAEAAATSKLGMGGGARGGTSGAKRPRGVAFGGVTEDSGMFG